MSDNNQPLNIPQIVDSAHFSVYGFINPNDFPIHSLSVGYLDNPSRLSSIGLTFSSSRYPEKHNTIVVSSADVEIEHQGKSRITYDLRDPSEGQLFNFDTYVFQYYHLSESERIQVGTPSRMLCKDG